MPSHSLITTVACATQKCGGIQDAYLKYIFSLCYAANAAASLGYIISCIGGTRSYASHISHIVNECGGGGGCERIVWKGVRSTPDITPLILFPFLICGGLILSIATIPSALKWLVQISPFQYVPIYAFFITSLPVTVLFPL